MSAHTVTVELTAAAYDALQRQAAAAHTTPADLAASCLEGRFGAAGPAPAAGPAGLRRLFGSVAVGHPAGTDNDAIDADLAAYAGEG